MKIYTSYFAKTKQLVDAGLTPIGVAQFPPSFFKYPNFASVAPTPDILFEYKKNPDQERYIKRYKEEVLVIFKDPKLLLDRLEYCSDGKDIALCCFEKPGDFCHRHILAEWFKEKLGIDVEEYKFGDECTVEELF